jgi:hypothetical protein
MCPHIDARILTVTEHFNWELLTILTAWIKCCHFVYLKNCLGSYCFNNNQGIDGRCHKMA